MNEATVVSCGSLVCVEGFQGEVLALSASSAYLRGTDGRLVVVHDAGQGHTPTSLLVRGARPLAWGLTNGDAAQGRLGRLRIGPMLLDARNPHVWRPPAASSGMVNLSVGPVLLRAAGEAVSRLLPACRQLRSAIDTRRDDLVSSSLRALVGSGPGATPSGDDALVGLLAVLHRVGHSERSTVPLRQLRAMIPRLVDRTTTISAHYLGLALAGHFGEHLTNLVDACVCDTCVDDRGLECALVARVCETGATSGRDALVGVAVGLELIAALEAVAELEVFV